MLHIHFPFLGDRNARFAINNILDLDLDMPDRTTQDYHQLMAQLEEEKGVQHLSNSGDYFGAFD